MLISENDIVFVTTTLYTKWLKYQSGIIKNLFPESNHIIIDGTSNWPNSWFYWIKEIKKSNAKYYIHLDEDFFITSKDELMKSVQKMEDENIDLLGVPDGYHQFRQHNPVAINSLLLIGRVCDLSNLDFDKIVFQWLGDSYINNYNIAYKEEYKVDFIFKHEIQQGYKYDNFEPYYAFMWAMKEKGCKFDYLFPYFDERFKSTNPRINADSPDIGIHMWYVRQWNNNMDVFGLPNIDRYNKLEKYLNESNP